MQPDAIPVSAQASVATLPPDAVRHLFGPTASLRGTERLALVRLGETRAHVAVEAGGALALRLDALDLDTLGATSGIRLQGPVGTLDAPPPCALASRLIVPDGLRSAWRMGDEATVGVGALALRVPVEAGTALGLSLDRALWLGAGSPETARWLPQTEWAVEAETTPDVDASVTIVARRVVTETDVRQARLRRHRIRLQPGQIVTPAARSLAREHGTFEEAGS